jgi:hypothetical protein
MVCDKYAGLMKVVRAFCGRLVNRSNQSTPTFTVFFAFFLCPKLFQSITWCSCFVSTSIKGVLGGLPTRTTRGAPLALRRDPAQATFEGSLPIQSSDTSLTGLLHRSDQCRARYCNELLRTLRVRVFAVNTRQQTYIFENWIDYLYLSEAN